MMHYLQTGGAADRSIVKKHDFRQPLRGRGVWGGGELGENPGKVPTFGTRNLFEKKNHPNLSLSQRRSIFLLGVGPKSLSMQNSGCLFEVEDTTSQSLPEEKLESAFLFEKNGLKRDPRIQ